ncbi:MAG: flagellar protein FliS [Desulfovibrio sp.]|nr:flagellar protein FliS [Desulfovibrio sp.]
MSKVIHNNFRLRGRSIAQGQLVVDLYDGALKYLQQARDQMVAQKYAARNILVNRALSILNELTRSLDIRGGGDLAFKLNNLYLLCSARLLSANQKMSLDDLDSVVHILTRLRNIYLRFPGIEQNRINSQPNSSLVENNR